jgi:hypothetical protein
MDASPTHGRPDADPLLGRRTTALALVGGTSGPLVGRRSVASGSPRQVVAALARRRDVVDRRREGITDVLDHPVRVGDFPGRTWRSLRAAGSACIGAAW